MAIPILHNWENYFINRDEGLGSSYERVILNKKLESIIDLFKCDTILEAPSFGFTGLSGINSIKFALDGKDVTILDDDKERLDLIFDIWDKLDLKIHGNLVDTFSKLSFRDDTFDLSWNFSALWFVEDLQKFLGELTRVTKKVIVLAVPNRAGIGYLTQKFFGKDDLKKYLKEENIIPSNFIKILNEYGWKLIKTDFIDCPPWPDIGMPKEKFLKLLKLDFLIDNNKVSQRDPISIMDYYEGKRPDFEQEMLRFAWLENISPWIFKRFWAHHRYYVFIKE